MPKFKKWDKELIDKKVEEFANEFYWRRKHSFDLVWLEDDLDFYPPFEAAYAVNESLLERSPDIEAILTTLSGKIDVESIRSLNYEVDVNHKDHKDVAI